MEKTQKTKRLNLRVEQRGHKLVVLDAADDCLVGNIAKDEPIEVIGKRGQFVHLRLTLLLPKEALSSRSVWAGTFNRLF